MAVLGNAVAPKIFAHHLTHPVVFGNAPWQRRGEMTDLTKFLHAKLLGFEEGLVDADGEPRVALHQGPADAHGVHDREYARLAKISLLDGRIIREHAAHVGSSIEEARRRPCTQ